MNKFAPKTEFLKKRATSLHRSGYSTEEISRMLHVGLTTAYTWINSEFRKNKFMTDLTIAKMGMTTIVPTLAYVPGIKLGPNSKYRMRPS